MDLFSWQGILKKMLIKLSLKIQIHIKTILIIF